MTAMKHLLNKTVEALRKHNMLGEGMNVCVCLSGGADSSVLLHVLFTLRDQLGITLSACHFHHGIRGEEADRDQSFCRTLCRGYGVPFYTATEDLPALQPKSGLSMEAFAREKRYQWFEELGKAHHIHRFATAHHLEDNAETVLFRVIRGTTVAGLSGIPAVRGKIIRPFLNVTKSEILEYASKAALSYVEDSTNASTEYTRNYLRHTVLPAMEKVNPSVSESLSRLSKYASADEAFLQTLLPPFEEKQNGKDLPTALLQRTVARNHQMITGTGLCYQHLDTIIEAIVSGCHTRITLSDGYECVVAAGCFSFVKHTEVPLEALLPGVLDQPVHFLCGGKVLISSSEYFPQKIVYNLSTEIPLSSKGICGMIRYRSRCPGDRLRLRGVNRSVKKLMSESRIPVSLRESLPVLCDDHGVIAVPFVGVADRVFPRDEEADRLIRIYIAENGV